MYGNVILVISSAECSIELLRLIAKTTSKSSNLLADQSWFRELYGSDELYFYSIYTTVKNQV